MGAEMRIVIHVQFQFPLRFSLEVQAEIEVGFNVRCLLFF
jgi:hypothetical protein